MTRCNNKLNTFCKKKKERIKSDTSYWRCSLSSYCWHVYIWNSGGWTLTEEFSPVNNQWDTSSIFTTLYNSPVFVFSAYGKEKKGVATWSSRLYFFLGPYIKGNISSPLKEFEGGPFNLPHAVRIHIVVSKEKRRRWRPQWKELQLIDGKSSTGDRNTNVGSCRAIYWSALRTYPVGRSEEPRACVQCNSVVYIYTLRMMMMMVMSFIIVTHHRMDEVGRRVTKRKDARAIEPASSRRTTDEERRRLRL